MKKQRRLWVVSGAVLVVLMLIGCGQTPNVTKDADVSLKVEKALLGNKELRHLNITVATLKGDVLLTGHVENYVQKKQVEKLVDGINGARTFHDHLSVKKTGGATDIRI